MDRPANPSAPGTPAPAVVLLRRLHAAQNDFHGGGGAGPLRELLSPEVTWHVPGRNAIAGHHRGIEEVLDHFARRRDLTARTLRTRPRALLTGDGAWAASLTDGEAVIGGRRLTWSTACLYRLGGGRVAECRLLPLDPGAFDAAWTAPAASVSTCAVTVRPRHCDAQGMVYAGRYQEFFEDAFLDWLDEHAGGYPALRGGGADLVIVASSCRHRRPARLGERIVIGVRPERAGRTSLTMAFTVEGPAGEVATGVITYASVGAGGGTVPLPRALAAAATARPGE